MATWLNDPLTIPLAADPAGTIENQPLSSGSGGSTVTISDEIPPDGSSTAPPLALIEVLVE